MEGMDYWIVISLSLILLLLLQAVWLTHLMRLQMKKEAAIDVRRVDVFGRVDVGSDGARVFSGRFELPPKRHRILAAINKLTVDELKHQLSKHKLLQQGSKDMLVERLRHCHHVEDAGTDDEQVKTLFVMVAWGIDVPRLAFVDKDIASKLITDNVEIVQQMQRFGGVVLRCSKCYRT